MICTQQILSALLRGQMHQLAARKDGQSEPLVLEQVKREIKENNISCLWILFKKNNFLIFLAVLELHCYEGFFSGCGEQGLLFSCGAQVSHCSGFIYCQTWALGYMGFNGCSSWALEHKLSSCGNRLRHSMACEIFPDQGWNLCSLHWQVDSLSLSYQGGPPIVDS